MSGSGKLAVLGSIVVCVIIGVIGAILEGGRAKRKRQEPEGEAIPSRTSVLAGMSFFCGLAAIVVVMASGVVTACASMGEITQISGEVHPHLELASRLTLYTGLLPSVMAVAFALAARGSITESRGTLRGRSLYRTGILLALVSGVLVLDAKVINPANWLPAGVAGGAGGAGGMITVSEEAPRGYLGVDFDPGRSTNGVRIQRIHPGSPAERAQLQPGDRITQVDGNYVYDGSELSARMGSLRPGATVELTLLRGDEFLTRSAVLAAPFSALIETLEAQATDSARLAVLRAAGEDRRYSVAQLREVCGTFSTDSSRVSAIQQALPQLSDPENAYQVLNALISSSSKEEVSRRIVELRKAPK